MKPSAPLPFFFRCLALIAAATACGFLLPSCSREAEQPLLFTLLDSTGITFRNDVKDSKEDNSFLFRNFYNGGGVALGDVNNDGLADAFFTSNQGENKLYINKGKLKFEDVSVAAGLQQRGMWSTGVTMADVNADGWLDIYVCNSGHIQDGNRRNQLYINQQNGSFTEDAKAYGLDVSGYCTQASFFDYDSDGDLDCFIINNSPIPFSSLDYAAMRDVEAAKWQVDEKLKGGGNHLYRNDQDRSGVVRFGFTEVTKEAGLHTGLISFGLGVSVADLNDDNYPDIYVGNDFIEKDYLYINQRDGTFKDELEERVQKISMSSMSSDVADINNDGHPEIFTTDMIPDDNYRLKTTGTFDNVDLYLSKQKAGLYHQYVRNCLQLNNGDGSFSEIGNYSGVFGTDWSWGSVFFDADNDGLNDLFVCNGIAKDVGNLDFLDFFSNEVYAKMVETGQRTEMDELLRNIPTTPLHNRIFRNKGNLQFEDAGERWGFTQPGFSNSVAYADLDNDGDLDLILNNENGQAAVYKNNSREQTPNHYVSIALKGWGHNPFSVGSKVKVYTKRGVLIREQYPVRGFQSSMDYKMVIGLGDAPIIDSLVVIWPDGSHNQLNAAGVDTLYTFDGSKRQQRPTEPATQPPLFNSLPVLFDKHTEDDYVDFYYERNLPQALSRQGPKLATGDVNGDGLEDVYIGGGKGQGGQLYLQTATGLFQRKDGAAFQSFKDFEDAAVLFFDADNDKDLDLFVGAGGNNSPKGSRSIEHRLYLNDGAGNFAINPKAFPTNDANIAIAVAADYDDDGDQDLFVGGRSVPYTYGLLPRSYLYQNNGGIFKDATANIAGGLMNVGMVTDAAWVDLTGDVQQELVVTGEWMTTKIFSYAAGRFTEHPSSGLHNLSGWWQTAKAVDLNNDGKQDLVLGNVGENFYLRPTTSSPAKLWVADFDRNGTVDQFLTQTIVGRDMPVFLKRDITDQFPGLKKDNLKHKDYANKSIQDLFGAKALSEASVHTFNHCASVVAINLGNGKFDVKPLPARLQLSSVNAICSVDINNDGKQDLVTGGNLFTFLPQFGRLDASYGDVLLNRGDGGFNALPQPATGLRLRGEVKCMQLLTIKGKQRLLVTQNNSRPLLLALNYRK